MSSDSIGRSPNGEKSKVPPSCLQNQSLDDAAASRHPSRSKSRGTPLDASARSALYADATGIHAPSLSRQTAGLSLRPRCDGRGADERVIEDYRAEIGAGPGDSPPGLARSPSRMLTSVDVSTAGWRR